MARTAAFKMPTLTKAQQAMDELGAVREQIKLLQEEEKKYLKTLHKCVGKHVIGNFYEGTPCLSPTTTLSRTKLLKFVTAAQLALCRVPGADRFQVRGLKKRAS